MGFTTVSFLLYFLPITLFLYGLARWSNKEYLQNSILLIMSCVFYAWCGIQYLLLAIVMTTITYFCTVRRSKKWMVIAIVLNILILIFFKYFNFFIINIENIIQIFHKNFQISVPKIPLPLGISFIVFQLIAFTVDIYKGEKIEGGYFGTLLYMLFFPQLVQGPIVRYREMAPTLSGRTIGIEGLEKGIRRFICGFAKKVLIADNLVPMSDQIFSMSAIGIPMGYAWLGMLCYALVIYYDFSGYSDMAIGLCEMFGFHISENFNYPYISKTIQEFWRRWHISLSSWFRDYVYIPLGGNRCGEIITYRNLIIVFLLTGLWHGASWTFVIWGVFHGVFQLLERNGLKKILNKLPESVSHIYCLLVVGIGWVFFRSDTLQNAYRYIKSMFVPCAITNYYKIDVLSKMDSVFWLVLIVGMLFTMPLSKKMKKFIESHEKLSNIVYILVFLLAIAEMLGSGFSPSIYTKF